MSQECTWDTKVDTGPVWCVMKRYMDKIFDQSYSLTKHECMRMYTHIYKDCVEAQDDSSGVALYRQIGEFLFDYLADLLKDGQYLTDEYLLEFYARRWELYHECSQKLDTVCGYFNRHWFAHERIIRNKKEITYEVYQLTLVMWRDHVFQKLCEQLTNALLKLIDRERCGTSITDSDLVNRVINSFVNLEPANAEYQSVCVALASKSRELSAYRVAFETPFLLNTHRFYAYESTEYLRCFPFVEYMKRVEQRLQEEYERVHTHLRVHETTKSKLVSTCESALISRHLRVFCDEFPKLVGARRNEDLARMHSLLSRVEPDGPADLLSLLEKHCETLSTESSMSVSSKMEFLRI